MILQKETVLIVGKRLSACMRYYEGRDLSKRIVVRLIEGGHGTKVILNSISQEEVPFPDVDGIVFKSRSDIFTRLRA